MVAALKPIYQAPTADAALLALDAFEAGPWGRKYAAIAPLWRRQWDQVIPFFAFPPEVRRIIYTTNAIESLNSTLRTAVRSRGHFPTDEAAIKLLYLVLRRVSNELEECSTRMDRRHDPVRHHVRRPVQRRVEGSSETDPSHKIPDRLPQKGVLNIFRFGPDPHSDPDHPPHRRRRQRLPLHHHSKRRQRISHGDRQRARRPITPPSDIPFVPLSVRRLGVCIEISSIGGISAATGIA